MKCVILIFLLTLFYNVTHARSPAVLPTYGVSINEANRPIPKNPKDKPSTYNFTKRSKKNTNQVQTAINDYSQKSMKSIPIYFTLFVLALPFMMWFFITNPNQLTEDKTEESEGATNVIEVDFSNDGLLSDAEQNPEEKNQVDDIDKKAS